MKTKRKNKMKCEMCGFVPEAPCQMDVHHIDWDHSNNKPDNLQVLCANCHRLEHAEPNSIDLTTRLGPIVKKVLTMQRIIRKRNAASDFSI